MPGTVIAVSRSPGHSFTKPNESSIRLLEGLGIEGDAHLGTTVQHRSRVAKDPSVPNLRQVHLIHAELMDELEAAGFRVLLHSRVPCNDGGISLGQAVVAAALSRPSPPGSG